MGFAPDVGTLQRLPKICGSNQSILHELCYTGRNFYTPEAIEIGLVSSRYCRSTLSECLYTAINDIATSIAALPNRMVAIRNIKQSLLYTRDHPKVSDGLEQIAKVNAVALQSPLVRQAMQQLGKKKSARTIPTTTTTQPHQHVDLSLATNHERNDHYHMNSNTSPHTYNRKDSKNDDDDCNDKSINCCDRSNHRASSSNQSLPQQGLPVLVLRPSKL